MNIKSLLQPNDYLLTYDVNEVSIMEKIVVVHYKHGDPYDVYVGRPTKWGNPFTVEKWGREIALEKYAHWILEFEQDWLVKAAIEELQGKVLACWCAPKKGLTLVDEVVCHGQILVKLSNLRINDDNQ